MSCIASEAKASFQHPVIRAGIPYGLSDTMVQLPLTPSS